MTPREQFSKDFQECLTDWRLGVVSPQRRGTGPEVEILRAGIAEVLELRLVALCLPLFETMRSMEEKLKCLK